MESQQIIQKPEIHAETVSCEVVKTTKRQCAECKKEISGKHLTALSQKYHAECFRCMDCKCVLSTKYFPLQDSKGAKTPLCENDYFRRLNLICSACNEILRGSYITALGKKFHLDHFTCSTCAAPFGPQESYYVHEDKVYCHYHFSSRLAGKCTGCSFPILKQFVEINKGAGDEFWHPECYMINKFWNVKLLTTNQKILFDTIQEQGEAVSPQTMKRFRFEQEEMELKVYDIWTCLSNFEESSAACISDMLLQVSTGNQLEAAKITGSFIQHVEILFTALDEIEMQLAVHKDTTGLVHTKEPKLLCKKIISFFSILSTPQDMGPKQQGVTQELLSLVTALAHYLKTLIRISLTAAIKVEQSYGSTTAIRKFLGKLSEVPEPGKVEAHDMEISSLSDLCAYCRQTIEEPCIKHESNSWHTRCFRCLKCKKDLSNALEEAKFNTEHVVIYCNECKESGILGGFLRITQLEQYTFLLRVAQCRLILQLSPRQDDRHKPPKSMPAMSPTSNLSPSNLSKSPQSSKSVPETGQNSTNVIIDITDIDPSSSNRTSHRRKSMDKLDRRLSTTTSIIRRTTIVRQNDKSAFASESGNEDTTTREIATRGLLSPQSASSPGHLPPHYNKPLPPIIRQHKKYLCQLSALEAFIVRHVTVLTIAPILKDSFTMEELLELVDKSRGSIWTRMKMGLKNNKQSKKEGTFGVPLEILQEKTGVESMLGHESVTIRIPAFADNCIQALKALDVTVEGIFRKNGNIRKLKEMCDAIDRNPDSVDLRQESAIQVAALLKKFLRYMPDPLLTFKLQKLFIYVSKIENPEKRNQLLHFAFTLLPDENRNLAEVLFLFFRWISSFAFLDDEHGNKMDISNMATVITPNILYSKSKDPTRDESFFANEAVSLLIENIETFSLIPDEASAILDEEEISEVVGGNLSSKDILRKCENFVKLRRVNSNPGRMEWHKA